MLLVQCLLLLLVVACLSEEHGCNIFATILRETSNEGFHRKLTSLVEVVNVHSNLDNCQLVLQENLPSNVFVNPDELRALARSKEVIESSTFSRAAKPYRL
ncbi:unnamed protein product [Bemisia tabaci]|uniref:Phosphatidylinositol-glycan biosynthesis class X protein n=1 Tax=Bemisia tabaci TaxID=7038 RepID=A0A9P0AFI6_BEMTA|nr:unnamed protein product [Bemisia tabaci]